MVTKTLIDKGKFLSSIPLFAELAADEIKELVTITHSERIKNQTVIFREGDLGTAMYFIVSGVVRVSISLAENEDLTLGRVGSGEAFGEIALFDSRQRTASVTTLESCEFLVIDRDAFIGFLMDHPPVAIQLLSTMSKRLRTTNDLIKDTLYVNVGYRLAETLQNLATGYGKNTKHGLRIDMDFTDLELAAISKLPQEVVTAQLQNWSSEGLIDMQHGYITLIKPYELAHNH